MPSSYYPSERLPSEPSYSADVFRHDLTKQRPSLGGHMNGRDDATVVHGFTSSSSEAGVTPIGDPHRGLFDDSEFHSPNAEMPSFEPSWWTAPTCVGDHTSFQEATVRQPTSISTSHGPSSPPNHFRPCDLSMECPSLLASQDHGPSALHATRSVVLAPDERYPQSALYQNLRDQCPAAIPQVSSTSGMTPGRACLPFGAYGSMECLPEAHGFQQALESLLNAVQWLDAPFNATTEHGPLPSNGAQPRQRLGAELEGSSRVVQPVVATSTTISKRHQTSCDGIQDRYERRLAATPLPVPAFDCASGEASIQKKAPPDIHAPDTHPLMEHYAPGTECTLQIKQRPYGNTKHCSHKPKCGSSTTRGSPPEIGCGSNKAKKTSRDDVILGIPASSALDSDFSMELAASNGWLQQAYQDEELEQSRQGKKFNVRFEVLGCGSHENSKQYNEWSAGNTALDYFNWKHLDPSPRVLGPLTKFELAQRVAVELREYMERQASHENHLMHGLRQVELDHILIVKVVYPTKASAQPVLGILPEYQALYV